MSSTRYIIVTLLKVLVVISLVIILFVVSTMIGYGVIGGGNPKDVFKEEIWTHILDFLNHNL
ncbi:DNA-directed RNA polymerase subunit beta [Enterococcus termitis]